MRRALGIRALAAAVAVAGALVSIGCDDDGARDPRGGIGPPTTTRFTGVYAGGSYGGRADITIGTIDLAPARPGAGNAVAGIDLEISAIVPALGTLSETGGGVTNLTGTYDGVADTLNVSGGGYTVRGTRTGPNGASQLAGTVTAGSGEALIRCVEDGANAVSTYCTTFESGITTRAGPLHLVITGTTVAGVVFDLTEGVGAYAVGSVNGSGATRGLAFSASLEATRRLSYSGTLVLATGDVTGTWALLDHGTVVDSGTWAGSTCLLGTTGPN